MKNISVIGIGRLGLCFALNLERAGYNILGCDIRKDYIESINNKTFKTIESDVERYLVESKNFVATNSIKNTINFSNVIFITVRTTSLKDGSYDCSQVDNVVKNIKDLGIQKEIKYLVISCNVNPGYSDKIQKELEEYNYIVSYNPEWIAQGSIIYDQRYPDLVVIGEGNKEAGNIIENVYKILCKSFPKIHKMDRLSAELTKISLNCYLLSKISLANMMGEVAVKSGVDPDKILNALGDDSRIGKKFIKYGFGYGGVCLPRDSRSFIKYANDVGIEPSMIIAAEKINKNHLLFQINEFLKNHPNKEELIVFDSVTYKKGVTIIEESQQLLFAEGIAWRGYKVLIEEHIDVINQVKEIYGDLFLYKERE